MAEKVTYYAIIDDHSSQQRPAGVLRHTENDEGEIDEVFSRTLEWEFSPLLYSAEGGDLTNDFVEISEAEADRIAARIRANAAEGRRPLRSASVQYPGLRPARMARGSTGPRRMSDLVDSVFASRTS